jgi:hypothetical protein
MIITEKFKKLSKKMIFSLKQHEIKSIIGRERLKFTYDEVVSYVQIIFEHSCYQLSFKYFYKKYDIKIKYSVFMKNIQLFSHLFKFLFHKMNETLGIKPSQLLNMVDTTLIEEKNADFIQAKDWNLHRVTTRNKKDIKKENLNSKKTRICGSKGLVFLNRQGQIYSAHLMNINHSDQNILKNHSFYLKELKGILLADRGFNNKAVRERLNSFITSVFRTNEPVCRLISPYHYKEKTTLTDKEKKLYKRRWKIETVFQNIKNSYSHHKLNLKGKYTNHIKEAKFYSAFISFNLSKLATI